jgi:hypothetical protein
MVRLNSIGEADDQLNNQDQGGKIRNKIQELCNPTDTDIYAHRPYSRIQ